MTDIVERLRERDREAPFGNLLSEAADEIERMHTERLAFATESEERRVEIEQLRAALQQIIAEADSDDGMTAWDGGDIARRALEQKAP
jgi:hypothetical protein